MQSTSKAPYLDLSQGEYNKLVAQRRQPLSQTPYLDRLTEEYNRLVAERLQREQQAQEITTIPEEMALTETNRTRALNSLANNVASLEDTSHHTQNTYLDKEDTTATPYNQDDSIPFPADEGAGGDDLDKELMRELAESGVKYNVDNVVRITKNSDSRIVWLEKGSESAELMHIIKEHGSDFANKGIAQNKIPNYIINAVNKGKIVGYQGRGTGRPIYEFVYNGTIQRVAITIGNNGYIVGANPVSLNTKGVE